MLDLPPSRETIAVYEAIRIESTEMAYPLISHERMSGESSRNAEAGPLAVSPVRWEIKKQSDPGAAFLRSRVQPKYSARQLTYERPTAPGADIQGPFALSGTLGRSAYLAGGLANASLARAAMTGSISRAQVRLRGSTTLNSNAWVRMGM